MKKSFKIYVVMALVLFVHTLTADVSLVKNGNPDAEIVLQDKTLSSIKFAAEEMQKYVEMASGAKLPIVNAPTEKFKNRIFIGESEYTKKLGLSTKDLKMEGFKIIAGDNYIAIIGNDWQRDFIPRGYSSVSMDIRKKITDDWHKYTGENWNCPGSIMDPRGFNKELGFFFNDATGTLYGAYDFLEQIGFRWYMPYYDFGTVIPHKKDIAITKQNLKKEPQFAIRHMRPGWEKDTVIWFKQLKLGDSYIYWSNHTMRDIIAPKEQFTAHPEYYAQINGKPDFTGCTGGPRPRLSSRELRAASMKYLEKIFDAYPEMQMGTLGMPDGYSFMDDGDATAGWDTGMKRGLSGKMSDYVWDFWLELSKNMKEKYPGKVLSCLAYGTYMLPPEKINKLPDNIAIVMCQNTGANGPLDFQWNAIVDARKQWLAMLPSGKFYIWDYFLFDALKRNYPPVPPAFYHFLQKDMKSLHGVCDGKFIEFTMTRTAEPKIESLGRNHLLYYIQAKLFWEPDLDVDALINEYCELFYGPAKNEMKEFVTFSEDVWMRPESRSVSSSGGFLKTADVERFFDILKRAREKAGDGVYGKRIALIESELQPLRQVFDKLKRSGPDIRGYILNEMPKIDGDLNKEFWSGKPASFMPLKKLVNGVVPRDNKTKTSIRLLADKSMLLIGVICYESQMDKIVANTKENDENNIFRDDRIEIYLETPERSYFKIAVNSNGAVHDESFDTDIVNRDTLPILWNPGVKAAVKKEKDFWSVEIMIPLGDMGSKPPNKLFPWGINVCRARMIDGKVELTALSPTGKERFFDLSKLGNLYIQDLKK